MKALLLSELPSEMKGQQGFLGAVKQWQGHYSLQLKSVAYMVF